MLTILMAMDAFSRPEPWSNRLIEGCGGKTARRAFFFHPGVSD